MRLAQDDCKSKLGPTLYDYLIHFHLSYSFSLFIIHFHFHFQSESSLSSEMII